MQKRNVVELKSNDSLWAYAPSDPIVGKNLLWLDEDGKLPIRHKLELAMRWVPREKKKNN